MTEEIKACDCKEKCIKKVNEWTFITSAVFVGALLAILLGANILRPKCPPPCPMMDNYGPRFERQLPPPPMMHPEARGEHQFRGLQGGPPPQFREHKGQRDLNSQFKHHNKDFRPDANPAPKPQK